MLLKSVKNIILKYFWKNANIKLKKKKNKTKNIINDDLNLRSSEENESDDKFDNKPDDESDNKSNDKSDNESSNEKKKHI